MKRCGGSRWKDVEEDKKEVKEKEEGEEEEKEEQEGEMYREEDIERRRGRGGGRKTNEKMNQWRPPKNATM